MCSINYCYVYIYTYYYSVYFIANEGIIKPDVLVVVYNYHLQCCMCMRCFRYSVQVRLL